MNLKTECVTRKGDIFYFTSIESNLIFTFDINTKSTKIVTKVNGEETFEKRLFGDILTWNDMFILVPANARNIWIVDSSFSNWEKIELTYPDISLKFLCATIVGDELYMIKHLYPYTVCLNLKTKEKRHIETGTDFFTGVESYNGELYFASCNSDRLYVYNVMKSELETYHLDFYNMSGVMCYDEKIVVTTRYGNGIAELNNKKEIINKYPILKAIACIPHNKHYYFPLWCKQKENPPIQDDMYFLFNSRAARKVDKDTWWVIDKDANITIFLNSNDSIINGKLSVTREELRKHYCSNKKTTIYEELDIFDLEEFLIMLK